MTRTAAQGGGEDEAQVTSDEVRCFEAAILLVLEASHGLRPADLARLVADACALLGATSTELLLVDSDQRVLVPLSDPKREHHAVEGSAAGQAYRRTEVLCLDGDPSTLWLPLLDGFDRVGVMVVQVPSPSPALVRRFAALATLVSELIVAKSAYTDLFTVVRRLQPMALAAEMAWNVLPPLTFVSDQVSVAGILKPAYDVAGDAFDYSIDAEVAHVALVDAMGHGLEASRMSSVAITTYRNCRRAGDDLHTTFDTIDRVIAEVFGDHRYVTGQFGRLELATGRLSWLNAGHPLPLHVRGDKVLGQLPCAPTAPAGWQGQRGPVAEVDLQPGDDVLLFTDGVVDGRSPEGVPFGVERLGDLLVRSTSARLSPPETVRRLCHDVFRHRGDELEDDATMLLLRWGRPPP